MGRQRGRAVWTVAEDTGLSLSMHGLEEDAVGGIRAAMGQKRENVRNA